jgi:hypothetical protein
VSIDIKDRYKIHALFKEFGEIRSEVPKWVINIESHNNAYTREILAASNTILIDEMTYCPHEFFARFRPSRKQTYAICERCGGAYCSRHIERVNDSYFCREHR